MVERGPVITDLQIATRLIVACVLSGLIGFEREWSGHEAGLRTHIMVCVGATLIMLTSMYVFDIYKSQAAIDPARIAAGVVTGIGFLGAGAIIRSQEGIRGLTTAASLWVVVALGLSIGWGFMNAAVIVTILVLFVLLLLRRLENVLLKRGGGYGSER